MPKGWRTHLAVAQHGHEKLTHVTRRVDVAVPRGATILVGTPAHPVNPARPSFARASRPQTVMTALVLRGERTLAAPHRSVVFIQHYDAGVQRQPVAESLDGAWEVPKPRRALHRPEHHHSVHPVPAAETVAQPIQRCCALDVRLEPGPPYSRFVDVVLQNTAKIFQDVVGVDLKCGNR